LDANTQATVIIAIIASTPGLVALYVQSRRDKVRAPFEDGKDAAEIIRQYSSEIKDMRKEMVELRDQIDVLQRQINEQNETLDEWERGIHRLCGQLTAHELTPVWKPRLRKAAD
jgi:peptidoglycan hydrolase CwlO-like protein